MAAYIRPDYRTKLHYTLKIACMFAFILPAVIIGTLLDTRTNRWEYFTYALPLFTIVPLGIAVLWAARMADVPHDGTSWRNTVRFSAIFNVFFVALVLLPYFRYTYVYVGPTVVRVDRITGSQCPMPPINCGPSAPHDPRMKYDDKAGRWRTTPR